MAALLLFMLVLIFLSIAQGKISPYIYGGKDVTDLRFSFMVYILYSKHHSNSFEECSGSLIHPGWVLAAAHCVPDPQNHEGLILAAGRLDMYEYQYHRYHVTDFTEPVNESELGLQERRASKVYTCNNFSYDRDGYNGNYDKDIALIRLDRPFNISENVSVVEIAEDKFDLSENCTIIGWGLTEEIVNNMIALRKADDVMLLPVEKCAQKEPLQKGPLLCIDQQRTTKTACKGDSGSPLLCPDKIKGIHISGSEDSSKSNEVVCDPNPVAYYLVIESYKSWIDNITLKDPTPTPTSTPTWQILVIAGVVVGVLVVCVVFLKSRKGNSVASRDKFHYTGISPFQLEKRKAIAQQFKQKIWAIWDRHKSTQNVLPVENVR